MKRSHELGWATVLLAAGAALRLGAPGADLPGELFSSQAPLQDAFWYLERAAQMVERPAAPPPESTPWDVPGWLPLARTWLRLWGSSLGAVQALGASVSLLTAWGLWRFVRAGLGREAGLAALALFALGYPFVGVGRTVLIYSPLSLVGLAALAVFLHGRRYVGRGRHVCTLGAWLVALLPFLASGRPSVLAACGGLALGTAVRYRLSARTLLLAGLAGGAGLALLWLGGAVPATVMERVERYLQADSPALAVWKLLRVLGAPVAYSEPTLLGAVNSGSGFGHLAPGACFAAGLGAVTALAWRESSVRARESLALLGGTALFFLVAGSQLTSRPLRHFAVVAPAVVGLAGYGISCLAGRRIGLSPGSPWLAALLAGWGMAQAWDLWAVRQAPAVRLEPGTLPPGLAVLGVVALTGVGLAWSLLRWPLPISPRARSVLAAVTLAWAVASAGRAALVVLRPSYLSAAARARCRAALPAGSRICGTYASYVALGSGLDRTFGHWVLVDSEEHVLASYERLRAEGLTHFVVSGAQARHSGLEAGFAAAGLPLRAVLEIPLGAPARGDTLRVLELPNGDGGR